MKTLCSLALLGLALASPSAYAEQALGRVRAIYSEAARGVLLDRKLQRGVSSGRLWADVELEALSSGKRRVLVQIPAELHAATGDLVAVQLEDRLPAQLAGHEVPMLRVSRVTEVRTRALAAN